MKTTRRELGVAAVAALTVKAEAQTTPAAGDMTQLIHDANQRNSDTLTKFEIPIATEPAFRFEP